MIPENQLEAAGQISKTQVHAISQEMLIGLMTGLQVVVGNPFSEMMNAVESDIC